MRVPNFRDVLPSRRHVIRQSFVMALAFAACAHQHAIQLSEDIQLIVESVPIHMTKNELYNAILCVADGNREFVLSGVLPGSLPCLASASNARSSVYLSNGEPAMVDYEACVRARSGESDEKEVFVEYYRVYEGNRSLQCNPHGGFIRSEIWTERPTMGVEESRIAHLLNKCNYGAGQEDLSSHASDEM